MKVFTFMFLALILTAACARPSPASTGSGAVIIDGLQETGRSRFASQAVPELAALALNVDYFSGEQVNIDLFRGLSARGYSVIVLRMHSGLLQKEGQLSGNTWLFTNEAYSSLNYIDERRTEIIVKARTDESRPWVFAIGPEFVRSRIAHQFGKAAIVAMGCYSLYYEDLARAFVSKGASAYIGWDGNLNIEHSDRAALELLKGLCGRKMGLSQALKRVGENVGADPTFGSRLVAYPPSVTDRTLNELIR